jgi:hypothetical protein
VTSRDDQKKTASPGRGPSYPIFDLAEAVSRIRKFYDEEGKAAAPPSSAVRHWGFSEKSIGLLREEGSGDTRRLSVSRLALDVLLHPVGSPEWIAALGVAARSPRIYADILSTYKSTGLPSDTTLKHYLITEKDLYTSGADSVVKNLRATIKFANLDGMGSNQSASHESSNGSLTNPPLRAEIGDFIQWESSGVYQFDEPRKVRAVQDIEGTKWVFVDGSETGIPINETSVEKRDVRINVPAPQLPLVAASANVTLGEREWLRGPLSKESSYRLFVQGELTSKEIGKLIRLLEAQKLVLDDDV